MAYELPDAVALHVRFRSEAYQLFEKIGEGGFGQVYKAMQNRTKKYVAIKFLTLSPSESAQKRQRCIARFHRECDLIRRLNHPNIVSLIDKGQQENDLLYAVYEFVDGITLKDQLAQYGPLSAVDAADIMAGVLDALAHAHEQGIIHRDIKPANIMLYHVGARRHVKVLDFGIGTFKHDVRHDDYQTLTLTQETLGTPTYSAPEQLRGEPALPQTDLYIWGLVFLECLTGRPVMKGSSLASVFHQQLSAANVPLGPLAGHHSALFFRRILNKKPLERPGNTVDVYQEFCQLHFADLVAEQTTSTSGIALYEAGVNDDMTLMQTARTGYSQITERKQISALSVIVTCRSSENESANSLPAFRDVIEMIHADQLQQCMDIAVRYGATHAGTSGDTILFYFGYPNVSDNDSRLCARAALDIWRNFTDRQTQVADQHGLINEIRIGLEAGMMRSIAGEMPVGTVANTATELARTAQPGQILCTSQVRALLQNQLIFAPVEKRALQPSELYFSSELYLLQGERLSEAFGFLRSAQKHQAFFGREALLRQLVARCTQGDKKQNREDDKDHTQPRLFHIRGEAGIGKSRLLSELREQLPHQTHWMMQCLPEHQNHALYPVLSQVMMRYQLSQNPEQKLSKIAAQLPCESEMKDKCLAVLWVWFHPLFNAPSGCLHQDALQHRQLLANMSPKQQRECLFLSLSQLLCLSLTEPASSETVQGHSTQSAVTDKNILFICEDLHWADPTTIAFIDYFIGSAPFHKGNARWINTSRTALPAVLKKHPGDVLVPGKLSHQDCRAFILALFESQPVSEPVVDLLTQRCDGNPLFLEELVTYLRYQKMVHQVNGRIEFISDEPDAHIPETLRESLQYQLNRLTFARETALLAAAIGRSFSQALLLLASDKDKMQLQVDLDELQRAKLIFIQRSVTGNHYVFQHALIRDAIYESAANQPGIHKQIALALEEISGTEQYPPALSGWHWSKTDTPERAIPCYLQAGEAASETFVIDDAVYYFDKALSLMTDASAALYPGQTPESEALRQYELTAHTGLADSLMKQARYLPARQHYQSAIDVSGERDPLQSAQLCIRCGSAWEGQHHHQQAFAAYDQAERFLAVQSQHTLAWWRTWLNVKVTRLYACYWQNDIAAMQQLIEEVTPEIDRIDDPLAKAQFFDARLQFRFRHTRYRLTDADVAIARAAYQAAQETPDNGLQIHTLFSLGFCCLFSQHFEEAGTYLHQALARAEKEAETTLKTRCFTYLAVLYRRQAQPEATGHFAEQAMACAEASDMNGYIAIAAANLAWVACRHHANEQALVYLKRSQDIWQTLSAETPFPMQWLALLTELELLVTAPHLFTPEQITRRLGAVVTTLTDTRQQWLPDSMIQPLQDALRHKPQTRDDCYPLFSAAIEESKRLGYL